MERFVRNGARMVIVDLPNSPGEEGSQEFGRELQIFSRGCKLNSCSICLILMKGL